MPFHHLRLFTRHILDAFSGTGLPVYGILGNPICAATHSWKPLYVGVILRTADWAMHECTNNFSVYGVLGNPIAPVL